MGRHHEARLGANGQRSRRSAPRRCLDLPGVRAAAQSGGCGRPGRSTRSSSAWRTGRTRARGQRRSGGGREPPAPEARRSRHRTAWPPEDSPNAPEGPAGSTSSRRPCPSPDDGHPIGHLAEPRRPRRGRARRCRFTFASPEALTLISPTRFASAEAASAISHRSASASRHSFLRQAVARAEAARASRQAGAVEDLVERVRRRSRSAAGPGAALRHAHGAADVVWAARRACL